jgi:hypothetical protein
MIKYENIRPLLKKQIWGSVSSDAIKRLLEEEEKEGRFEQPKTEEERRKRHYERFGTPELPQKE